MLGETLLAAKEQIVICGSTIDEHIAGRVLADRKRVLAPIMADHVEWRFVYVVMAAAMAIPVAANLLAVEPTAPEKPGARWRDVMRDGVIGPFVDFFRRYRWPLAIATLAFILLFKIPEQATIGGIMSPFYRDMGFSQTEIGAVSKIWGVWIGIAGVFLGGAAVARFGVERTLLFAIVICGGSNLSYLLLLAHPGSLLALTFVISATDLTLGFLGPPTVAFLSSLVNQRHTATQYALLASLVNLPGKILGFFAGGIVAATTTSLNIRDATSITSTWPLWIASKDPGYRTMVTIELR